MNDQGELNIGDAVELSEAQAHYILGVMRLREGSSIRVFDGSSGEFLAKVNGSIKPRGKSRRGASGTSEKPSLSVQCLLRSQASRENSGLPPIELMFAPIRRQRLKILVEKAVEVGAARLTPVLTSRTQSSAADPVALSKLGLTVIEAAEQCERLDVPYVGADPVLLPSLLHEWDTRSGASGATTGKVSRDGSITSSSTPDDAFKTIFVCNERDADSPPLMKALADFASTLESGGGVGVHYGRTAFLVGPEGGFAPEEVELMAQCPSVRFVSLGPTVLRAETASVYALSCWNAFWTARLPP